ncbi:hypothetical protein CO674_35135 [Rhizobium hidalgonense]|uniref:Transposase n=1 Tax=Rhizobium hidalgonense TaxID=1538159 RepID=A0ABX4JJD4_9HYPH|nr:hypothetical protein CO674_35135 [Rhizobium hidalgonense]PON03799.1 hypothetical protein ATY29_30325 [Rhizobium hidalgonense]
MPIQWLLAAVVSSITYRRLGVDRHPSATPQTLEICSIRSAAQRVLYGSLTIVKFMLLMIRICGMDEYRGPLTTLSGRSVSIAIHEALAAIAAVLDRRE